MSGTLRLTIATPSQKLVDAAGVKSVRAEDETGSFGILPRHANLLTVLSPSVLRWKTDTGDLRYCAVDSGILTVSGGTDVAVACREGLLGDDLQVLTAKVLEMRSEKAESEKTLRVDQTRLHARAVRAMMHLMRGEGGDHGA